MELRSSVVNNELRCTFGWQEMIAREPPSTSTEPVYLKTLCRRIKAQARQDPPAQPAPAPPAE